MTALAPLWRSGSLLRPLVELLAELPPAGLAGAGSLGLTLLAARAAAVRRTLRTRRRVTLLPSDDFDPTPQAVERFAAAIGRTRPVLRDWLDAPASGVRLLLDHDDDAVMRTTAEVPERDLPVLRAALSVYPDVQLRDQLEAPAEGSTVVDVDDLHGDRQAVRVARAELVLARPSQLALADVGLDPDPLQAIASVIADTRPELGDRIEVAIDLRPVAPGRRRRLRRRLLRRARHREAPTIADVLAGPDAVRRRRLEPVDLVQRRAEVTGLAGKLGSPQPLLAMQLLVRCSSTVPGRPQRHLHALLACFDTFAGNNHLRVAGVRVPGVVFLGADLPLLHGRFDRRMRTGRFAPARRQLVTATEIAGLLKPPSVRCKAVNVARSGGTIAPPPPGLPTFATDRADLIPLGTVPAADGSERPVGVRVTDTVFTYYAGRSRYGKTETALLAFIHLTRSGHGAMFLDPHADAINAAKAFLTDAGIAERVIEIDLADLAGRHGQPAWNLFDVAGRPAWEAGERVEVITDAFAAALGWDERNTRALNLTAQAAQALVELARVLPPQLAPTLFQVPTLLGDEAWRTAVLPFVAPPTRAFFEHRFPKLPAEAITPVTNLVDRLRVARPVAALLGQPRSTLDLRAAMDAGRILLVCPGAGGTRDRLVAALAAYAVLHDLKARSQTPAATRRPFWLFLDELVAYDSPNMAALLEQAAKFGGRGHLLNQDPERLSAATRNAIMTNRSHIGTMAVGARSAALLTREWGGEPDPATLTRLPRYRSVVQVTLRGRTHPPFLVHGVRADMLHADSHHPERVADLNATIDRTAGRRPVDDALAVLDRHDDAIVAYLTDRAEDRRAALGGGRVLPVLPDVEAGG